MDDQLEKKSAGRPEIPINWKEVDNYLIAGCKGPEVAAAIGMHPGTFYDRCKSDKGMYFTDYAAEKRAKGNSMLLGKQFGVAMQGDKAMLIWLGKQRLDQREPDALRHEPDTTSLNRLADVIEKSREKSSQ